MDYHVVVSISYFPTSTTHNMTSTSENFQVSLEW